MTEKKRKTLIFSAFAIVILTGLVLFFIFDSDDNPQYKVTFDLNGGEMSVTETIVTLNESYSLPFPTKAGYQFKGWYDGDALFPSMGIWSLTSDLRLKAMWEISDDVGFVYEKADGGFKVIGYKGVIKERIVGPETYNGEPVVGIDKDTFVDLKAFLDDGTISTLLLYIPFYFDEECDNIAFDDRVSVARYDDVDDKGFTYTKAENGYVLEDYYGGVQDNIIVPTEYKGMPVIKIRKTAWNGLKAIIDGDDSVHQVNIYVPNGVENLLSDAAVVDKIKVVRYTDISEEGNVYLFSKGIMSFVGYVGDYNDKIVIPSEYDGVAVTKMGSFAFYGTEYFLADDMSEPICIYLPNTVNYVTEDAFMECGYVTLRLTADGEIISDASEIFDWICNTTFVGEKFPIIDVICNFRDYLGADFNSKSPCYVKFELNGGKIVEYNEIGKDENGNPIYEAVEVNSVFVTASRPYELPTPHRDGYSFDGWYFNGELLPTVGDAWKISKYISIEARWTEIEKEG